MGCTPEEDGFKKAPVEPETVAAWCPCGVSWSATYLGPENFFEMSDTESYPVLDGMYGPLIGFSVLTPRGAKNSGPSPTCTPLTPPSQSLEATLQRGSGVISGLEDRSKTLLIDLTRISERTQQLEGGMQKVDDEIEDEVRLCLVLGSWVVVLIRAKRLNAGTFTQLLQLTCWHTNW